MNARDHNADGSSQASCSTSEVHTADLSAVGMCVEDEYTEGMSQAASEEDVLCGDDTQSSYANEGSFAAELSDPVEEPDEVDSGDEGNAQLHDDDGSADEDIEDDFTKFFAKLGQETLPH